MTNQDENDIEEDRSEREIEVPGLLNSLLLDCT